MSNETKSQNKLLMIKFFDRPFTCDEEVWSYIEGYANALNENGLQWFGMEFNEPLIVDSIIFNTIQEWVSSQG